MAYKAFISYSHTTDGPLAPKLQSGLQRIAKPFYRLRAMRVFRDETSLHLTTKLWPTIQKAIGESENFILMASPAAAASPWVQEEVAEWLSLHKDVPENFYIVLTDGEAAWKGKDFDWDVTTALPRVLEGKFEIEPFYLDFRWARTDEQLSLRNPKFLDSVGKLVAAVRDIQPDIVFGEDVRQHRRFKQVVAATVLLLALLVGAASYWAYSANERKKEADAARGAERVQRDQAVAARGEAEQRRLEAEEQTREAVRQRGIAEEQTREAVKQKGIAEEQTKIAEQQRNRAEEQTRIAVEQRNRAEEQTQIAERRRREAEEARDEAAFQLAETLADRADEQSAPGKDLVQALHLANRAALVSPKGRPETSLHVARVLHMAASLPRALDLEKADARLVRASLDADLKHLLAMTGDYRLGLWDVQTGRRAPLPAGLEAKVGRPGDPATGDGYVKWESLGFSPEGGLAKAVFKDDRVGSYTLWVWEAATGEKRGEITMEEQPDAVIFSADGRAVLRKSYHCGGDGEKEKKDSCCLAVLWQADKSAPPPAELSRPCEGEKGDDDEEGHRQLLYRGRRPVLVEDRGDPYDGQYEERREGNWVAFGMSRDQKTIAAVSRNGQVNFWEHGASPLMHKWPAAESPLAARIAPDGASLLMLTRDGQLVQQRFDGTQVWSAPVSMKADGVKLGGGAIWNTSRPDAFLVNYWSGNEEEGGEGQLELWNVGDARPRRQTPFGVGPVQDLVLSPDEVGGVAEVWGEEEYNYVRRWSFDPPPPRPRPAKNVVKGLYLGVTRDGKVMLEGDDRELRFLDPFTREPVFAPFLFSTERSISGRAVAAILKQSYGLRATGSGVSATLPNGQTAELYRDRVGARFEVGEKVVRGTVTEGGHVLSPDGKLICGIRSYRSAGGLVGPMHDLVVREVETGRIVAGHYRLPSNRIVGFTPGNRAVLVQNHAGELTELYVHGGHDKAPTWYGDIGPALTGVRMLPNLGLSSLGAAEYAQARDNVRRQLQEAAAAPDEARQLLLRHLF